jgi:hypothetical protein
MTIAELHGKLNPERPQGVSERMEDLLTSDVFGTMKYAGWDKGFIEWINKAEVAPVSPTAPPISSLFGTGGVSQVYYKFWPILNNGREPDLALLVMLEKRSFLLVVVEAKYFSGTSDWDDEEWAEQHDLTGSQLTDQVLGLYKMSEKELLHWFDIEGKGHKPLQNHELTKIHLFITMNSVLPVLDYEKAIMKMKGTWPVYSYWLSWNSLSECIEKYLNQRIIGKRELLQDLYLLLQKKGLIPFSGFSMSPVEVRVDDASFWIESYWAFKHPGLPEYQSFLRPL